jgi:concanavalin A-like lectin/glucanase superfamily protein
MRNRSFALWLCLLATACAHAPAGSPKAIVWNLERVTSIGGLAPEVLGAPKVSSEGRRKSLCFDGKADGLLLPVNPIAGWQRFTIEILFKPDGDGPPEQRFLHIQDEQERRVLIETRVIDPLHWSLDTYLRDSEADKLTLLDKSIVQATDRWHWAALVYDGNTMTDYVDASKQLSGTVIFRPMGAGRISLGVRQNRIHWFKGCIAQVRFMPVALDASELRRPN